MLLRRRVAGVPALEALLAVGEQGRVVGEPELEAILGRGVVFAIVVFVAAADGRAILVDSATAIGLQVAAGHAIEDQEPAVLVLVSSDLGVRHLPQKDLEIVFRTRRVDLLGDIGAALGVAAEIALVVALDLDSRQVGVRRHESSLAA